MVAMTFSSTFRLLKPPGLNEGQSIEFEVISNPGKTSAENLKVQRWKSGRHVGSHSAIT
jgi:hypothetical protein